MIVYKSTNKATGVKTSWHEVEDKFVEQKTFDPTEAIESATKYRNEVIQPKNGMRLAMRIPYVLLHQMRTNGELGDEAFVNGTCVIDQKKLSELMKKYSKFACMDKL